MIENFRTAVHYLVFEHLGSQSMGELKKIYGDLEMKCFYKYKNFFYTESWLWFKTFSVYLITFRDIDYNDQTETLFKMDLFLYIYYK